MRTNKQRFTMIATLIGFGVALLIWIVGISAFHQDVAAQISLGMGDKFNIEKAISQLYNERRIKRREYLAELMKQIKGRESEPAGEVFKNVKTLKKISANRFLMIMDIGYSRALGVDCSHCHVPGKWESYEKPEKGIAVEMANMSRGLNNDTLKSIKNLKNPRPLATCTVCHRREIIPATNLPRKRNNSTDERAPNGWELASITTQFGWKPALAILQSAKRDYPKAPIFRERNLTRVGYNVLKRGRATKAVELFKVLVNSYPKSANAYGSLSDGLIAAGNKPEAIKNARIAIRLAMSDSELDQKTRDRIIKRANQKLKSIKNE